MHLRPFVRSWGCWSKKEVCSGALLAHCYFEELKIDCAIDQLKPGLKSKVNGAIFFLLFKECVSRKCASGLVHNAHSLCSLHTGTHSSTQTCQTLKLKDYSVKEYYCVGYINTKMSYMS